MRTKEQLRVFTRWMIRRDYHEVLAIEFVSFGTDAWTEDDFLTVLRERNSIGMIAEVGDKVVGFLVYQLEMHHIEILNIAVDPEFRGRGVASQLVGKLTTKLNSHRRSRIVVNVDERNIGGQLFFHRCGFKATAVVRRFYENPERDGYRFTYGCEPEEEGSVDLGGEA